MSSTVVRTEAIPALGRDEAMRLAGTEYERFGALIRSLGDADWDRPTDCDRWTVRGVVSHLVEMAAAMTTMREMMRQQRAARPLRKAEDLSSFDAWTEYQARSSEGAEPGEIVARYEDAVPEVLRVRGRSSPLRLLRFPSPPYGWFSMAYLRDDILTRDVWMHRADITRAAGREMELTPDHDGRFVANIVRDLGRRWDRPFTLELTGPAGGRYIRGSGGDPIRLDAVDFCRVLSGRGSHERLPGDVVPF